jgi:hypothetical protein
MHHVITLTGTVNEIVRDQREPDRAVVRISLDDTKTRPAFSLTYDMAREFGIGEQVEVTIAHSYRSAYGRSEGNS